MGTKFQGWTSAEQFAAEQERLYQQRNQAIAKQMCRDARRPKAMEMVKVFVYVCLIAGAVMFPLFWLASAISKMLENL